MEQECSNNGKIKSLIIKLNRDYFNNLKKTNNSELKKVNSMVPVKAEKYNKSGYMFPHMFMYYDSLDLIQDYNNLPIIYHHSHRINDKRIL